MFIILLHCVRPLTVVEKYLQEHRNFLDKHYAVGFFLSLVPRHPGSAALS